MLTPPPTHHSYAACFKVAIDLGFNEIAIIPHIDDGRSLGGWRNTLLFDPTVPYGGFSYNEVVLWPLVDAAKQSLKPDTKVCVWCVGLV